MVPVLQLDPLGLSAHSTIQQLESLIAYHFASPGLVETALTHGSRANKEYDYQRLEFLGDRVLSLVIAEDLFHRHGTEQEGQLAVRLSLLVRAEACAEVGKALGLEEFIIVGTMEKRKGIQRITSVLGDVVEALIGAVYLDGGLPAAREFILKQWSEMLSQAPSDMKDAKTFVQEWALGRALPLPAYNVVKREGPQHAPTFTIELQVSSLTPASGSGGSKQMAEMAAARALIAREGLR